MFTSATSSNWRMRFWPSPSCTNSRSACSFLYESYMKLRSSGSSTISTWPSPKSFILPSLASWWNWLSTRLAISIFSCISAICCLSCSSSASFCSMSACLAYSYCLSSSISSLVRRRFDEAFIRNEDDPLVVLTDELCRNICAISGSMWIIISFFSLNF